MAVSRSRAILDGWTDEHQIESRLFLWISSRLWALCADNPSRVNTGPFPSLYIFFSFNQTVCSGKHERSNQAEIISRYRFRRKSSRRTIRTRIRLPLSRLLHQRVDVVRLHQYVRGVIFASFPVSKETIPFWRVRLALIHPELIVPRWPPLLSPWQFPSVVAS